MSHRSILLTLGIVLLLLGVLGAVFFLLLRHEADWYAHGAVPPGQHRLECSAEFFAEFNDLMNAAASERVWYAQFTDEQINSFFEEGFVQYGLDRQLLAEGVKQPRVVIEPGRLRLAFRYGKGIWATVISIDLGIWLAARAENAVVIEVEKFRAGALPISAQSILQDITAAIKQNRNNIEVNWYRHPETGHPCAVIRFQADQQRPTVLLQAVQLEQGKMTIRGRATDGSQLRALLGAPELAVRTEHE